MEILISKPSTQMILFYFSFSLLEVRQNNVAKEKKNVKFMPMRCEKKKKVSFKVIHFYDFILKHWHRCI